MTIAEQRYWEAASRVARGAAFYPVVQIRHESIDDIGLLVRFAIEP